MPDELELVRLAGSEIDDQAIAEISDLLARHLAGPLEPSALLLLSMTGPMIVARRPCGLSPEIVGVAALAPRGEGGFVEVVAVHPDLGGPLVSRALRARVRHQTPQTLFRPRERKPLGLGGSSAERGAGGPILRPAGARPSGAV